MLGPHYLFLVAQGSTHLLLPPPVPGLDLPCNSVTLRLLYHGQALTAPPLLLANLNASIHPRPQLELQAPNRPSPAIHRNMPMLRVEWPEREVRRGAEREGRKARQEVEFQHQDGVARLNGKESAGSVNGIEDRQQRGQLHVLFVESGSDPVTSTVIKHRTRIAGPLGLVRKGMYST
ncbi:hypothetical protein BT69DRAFT_1344252 [Atractiella rhizophila]|nr:hypothetical protein BT69DRAFT_1344252 [Atractiella rhizophila]